MVTLPTVKSEKGIDTMENSTVEIVRLGLEVSEKIEMGNSRSATFSVIDSIFGLFDSLFM